MTHRRPPNVARISILASYTWIFVLPPPCFISSKTDAGTPLRPREKDILSAMDIDKASASRCHPVTYHGRPAKRLATSIRYELYVRIAGRRDRKITFSSRGAICSG